MRRRLAGFLQALPIVIDDETASQAWNSTAQLAEQHQLTAYLELALRLDLPLATSDTALMTAVEAAGVPLLTSGR